MLSYEIYMVEFIYSITNCVYICVYQYMHTSLHRELCRLWPLGADDLAESGEERAGHCDAD